VRIDPLSQSARFRVIGEDRWSDEWNLTHNSPAEEQPRYLAAGICGSGIIELVGELLINGILLPDGQFDPQFKGHPRSLWQGRTGAYILATADETTTGEPILVTQADVRNIQLAKAALYAGCKLLMRRASVSQVDSIVLAGAFGSYIDPKYAMIIGLIPDCDLDRITAVGNAAGDGARIALLNVNKRAEAAAIAAATIYIETAVDPDFQREFVAALHLPHASDSFPHLEGIVPPAATANQGNTRARRRRRRARPRTD
jgi:uncharacterized 2Fe-2S/4Fe-4S cluster protein (DUF4445 family)